MSRMRNVGRRGTVAAIMLSWSAASAAAQLLVYEPFDYPAGTELDGLAATGVNLSGSYSTSTIQDLVIASPGGTYGSLFDPVPGVVGNRIGDESGAGADIVSIALDEEVLIGDGEAIYFSGLFTLDDANNRNRFARVYFIDEASGDELAFGEPVVGVSGLRVEADTAATVELIAAGEDNAYEDGQTLWLVGRYFNSGQPQGDELALVGYDTALAQAIAPTFDLADPNAQLAYLIDDIDIDFTRISSLRFEIRGAGDKFIDEMRIGRTYGSVVVPEPATGVLLFVAVVMIGLMGCSETDSRCFNTSCNHAERIACRLSVWLQARFWAYCCIRAATEAEMVSAIENPLGSGLPSGQR